MRCGIVGLFFQEEIEGNRRRDEAEEHEQEFALLNQVGFAGLENDLGNIEHRFVGRLLSNLVQLIEADAQRAGDDQRP